MKTAATNKLSSSVCCLLLFHLKRNHVRIMGVMKGLGGKNKQSELKINDSESVDLNTDNPPAGWFYT